MKILLLAKFLPKDGATTHMYTIANGFIKKGHEVSIISGGPSEDINAINLFNSSLNYDIKHYKVKFPNYHKYSFIYRIKQFIAYILVIPKAIKIMRKIKPDIIHVHYPVTSYVAWIYCRLSKKKFITTYHAKGIHNHILHKKADGVIAISTEMEKELTEVWKYEKEKINLIFNGISSEIFNKKINNEEKIRIKKEFKIPINKIIIGFVGTLAYKKGIDLLFKACSDFDKSKFHIVLVGDGNRDWVLENMNKYQIAKNVTIEEFQNPIKFYNIFDIFVLPSRYEAFGLVAIEAMMQGIPVIRSNLGGADDVILNGKNGYIFKNEDVQELKNYINILLNDKSKRNEIGKLGEKNVLKNFSEEKMINELIKTYQKFV